MVYFYYNSLSPIFLYPYQLYADYRWQYATCLMDQPCYQNQVQNLYGIDEAFLSPKYKRLYRDIGLQYITDWLGDRYDEYKEYLFKCFYKYPYQFNKIKICLQQEYNVPGHIAENITNMAKYGYETAGWSDKKILLNKLSGTWQTNLGTLDLKVSEDLDSTGDTIFPYANKVSGSYNWNGGGKIDGSVNWGGVLSGDYIEDDKRGDFKITFAENNGKRTFSGTYTDNGEVLEWEGKQIKEY